MLIYIFSARIYQPVMKITSVFNLGWNLKNWALLGMIISIYFSSPCFHIIQVCCKTKKWPPKSQIFYFFPTFPTFLWPSNSKCLPPAQNYSVFVQLIYNIIKQHYSMKKNRLVNKTNQLWRHSKLTLMTLYSNMLWCAQYLEGHLDFNGK